MNKSLELESIRITKNPSYADNPGRYVAQINYKGERGEVTFPIGPEISEALLVFIGPLLVKFSTHAAQELVESTKHLAMLGNGTIEAEPAQKE